MMNHPNNFDLPYINIDFWRKQSRIMVRNTPIPIFTNSDQKFLDFFIRFCAVYDANVILSNNEIFVYFKNEPAFAWNSYDIGTFIELVVNILIKK